MNIFQVLTLGATLIGGLQQKRAADSAAQAATEVGEFNAGPVSYTHLTLPTKRKV